MGKNEAEWLTVAILSEAHLYRFFTPKLNPCRVMVRGCDTFEDLDSCLGERPRELLAVALDVRHIKTMPSCASNLERLVKRWQGHLIFFGCDPGTRQTLEELGHPRMTVWSSLPVIELPEKMRSLRSEAVSA